MRWIWSVLIVGTMTGLAAAGRGFVALPDVEMLYVLGIIVAALWLGRRPALLTSALSVATYDFFFVLPFHTFRVHDARFLLTFVMMFAIGLVVSGLVERLRRQEQASAARESRAALLSSVSHDLRTPLAAITGAATTLRDDRALDETTRRELLDDVCEEAERLERLVGNLLDMTRLERRGMMVIRPEWVPCEELVGSALVRMERRLLGREVRTRVAPDLPLVPCDPVLLQQLLINLLDNAAKHTPAGSEIEMAATGAAGAVILEVSDRGPGLPRRRGEELFEPFTRGARAGAPGSGLGLAICRGIAHAHGGALVAADRAGGGATFRLTIPLREAPPRVTLQESLA
jgi:two-component system sensor histidine kinase KdpD